MKTTEAQRDIAGQLLATWVSQQMRLREIAARPFGRFTLSDGIPIVIGAEYHRPDHMIPRLLDSHAN